VLFGGVKDFSGFFGVAESLVFGLQSSPRKMGLFGNTSFPASRGEHHFLARRLVFFNIFRIFTLGVVVVFHFVRIFLVAGVMFLSVSSLGVANEGALVCAAVPVVLGLLNIFPAFGYALTGVAFVVASANVVFPNFGPQVGQIYRNVVKANGGGAALPAVPAPGVSEKNKR
jgi:hypothetical protein